MFNENKKVIVDGARDVVLDNKPNLVFSDDNISPFQTAARGHGSLASGYFF